MKKNIALFGICLILTACSQFSMSVGVGYRKIPPEVGYSPLNREVVMSLTPQQIELLKLIVGMPELLPHALPKNNRVDLGAYADFNFKK